MPPGEIPGHIEVDVTELHAGQHAEAGDVKLPEGVTLYGSPDKVIVSIAHAKTEDAGAEGTATDREEPVVVKKGKTDED